MQKRKFVYGWAAALVALFLFAACENPSGDDGNGGEKPVPVSGAVNPADLGALGLEEGQTAVIELYNPQGEKIGQAEITGGGAWAAEIPPAYKGSDIKAVLVVPTENGNRTFEVGTISIGSGGTATVNVDIPGAEEDEYTITKLDAVNGSYTVSRGTAFEGELITLTANPISGYKAGSITITKEGGGGVMVSQAGTNKWTFTMPAANVTVGVNFIAEGSAETYTVTWKNHDGTVLETDMDVEAGATPSYDGTEPARAADDQYTYTFSGWDPALTAVTGDAVYTATF
ncbi:MAG: hypothetical protein LBS57_00440, partial [Treponema sp.]|nr:hypothetical protein [Treponema sp.]